MNSFEEFVGSVVIFVFDALVTYAMLRWLFGVSGHVAAPVAWLAASFYVQVNRIERKME